MLRLIVCGFLLTFLYSCAQKRTDLEKNSVRVTYKDFEPSDQVLKLAGMDLLDKFDIEIYSDRTFYSVFVAYYSRDNEKIFNEVTLLDYQILEHAAFNQEKFIRGKNELVYDKVGGFFRVDEKANVLLHNDSLYYALFNEFVVAPITMDYIQSSGLRSGGVNNFYDSEVIPLSKKYFKKNGLSNLNSNCEYYMQIGLVLSDKPCNLDFNKMLDSENVKMHLDGRLYDKNFKEKYPELVSLTDSFLFSQ